MALSNFIPTVWSARLLVNLNDAHVAAQPGIVNRDYEGEIASMGDTVRINSIGRVTISDYTRNTDITSPEELDESSQVLVIDQGKYYNFAVDDVDAAQSNVNVMDGAMREAAWGLNDAVDDFLLDAMRDAGANTLGTDASPKTPTAANSELYEYFVDAGVLLDEDNIPNGGRFGIIPPWAHGLLLKDDRFVKSGADAADSRLLNGQVGEAAGIRLVKSNNVPLSAGEDDYQFPIGHSMATSFAEQIVKTEAYRPEKRFADAVKGLHVYGGKVTRPDGLVIVTATKPA